MTAKSFSLATEGQDSSRGGRLPQKLDLAAFNGMRVSPSLPTSNPEVRPHTSAAHIRPNPSRLRGASHHPTEQLAAPNPAPASLLLLRPTPGGSSSTTRAEAHTMSTTIHAAPPGPIHSPICWRLSPPLHTTSPRAVKETLSLSTTSPDCIYVDVCLPL
ncbi:hypothetical protein BJY52DRAFT_782538 [Lactarius psammicola]|nr:hypothetical protein BJY52DRAFT_782538 [Lactarius psammicola]